MWTKGQSGNPKGRPRRGNTVAEYLRSGLDAQAFAAMLIDDATNPNNTFEQRMMAKKVILPYLAVPLAQELAEAPQGDIRIQVNYVTNNQFAVAGASPGPAAGHSRSQALLVPGVRETLGKDNAGHGPRDSAGARGQTDGMGST